MHKEFKGGGVDKGNGKGRKNQVFKVRGSRVKGYLWGTGLEPRAKEVMLPIKVSCRGMN